MTGKRRATRSHAARTGALMAAALVVAACGGSSGSNKASSPPASSSSGGSGGSAALTIGTAKGSAGTYLVGASGRALYLWVADTNGHSVCSGACAKVWPPLLASTTPAVTGGASASDLGLIARSGGQRQVTYKGHPLYYFEADHGPGMTTGQGSNSFGAKWWLVSTSGVSITRSNSSSSSSGASSSRGAYG